jgi:hypothetical protein
VVQDTIELHKAAPTQAGVPSAVVTQRHALPQDVAAWQLLLVTSHDAASVVVVVVETVVVVVGCPKHCRH